MDKLQIIFLISLVITVAINNLIVHKVLKNDEKQHMIYMFVRLGLGLAALFYINVANSNLVYKIGWGFIVGLCLVFFKKSSNKEKTTGH